MVEDPKIYFSVKGIFANGIIKIDVGGILLVRKKDSS
jgi:hypothetical protein